MCKRGRSTRETSPARCSRYALVRRHARLPPEEPRLLRLATARYQEVRRVNSPLSTYSAPRGENVSQAGEIILEAGETTRSVSCSGRVRDILAHLCPLGGHYIMC